MGGLHLHRSFSALFQVHEDAAGFGLNHGFFLGWIDLEGHVLAMLLFELLFLKLDVFINSCTRLLDHPLVELEILRFV